MYSTGQAVRPGNDQNDPFGLAFQEAKIGNIAPNLTKQEHQHINQHIDYQLI